MMTDTEIKLEGVRALMGALGEVQAERFISLILREPFNYTQWQQALWPGLSLTQISEMAMAQRNATQQ